MTSSREKVLELLADNRITAAEADTLLAAMEKRPSRLWQTVLNPSERVPSTLATALAAVPLALQVLVERAGAAYNGALDLHAQGTPSSWHQIGVNLLVTFPLVAAALWGAARIAGKQSRVIDMTAVASLSRWPMAAAGLLLLPVALGGVDRLRHPGVWDTVLIVGTLPLFAWSITILCLGFRTVSGLRGGKLAWAFIGALVVAEGISKLLLYVA
jgi:hypothetical protein